MAGAADAQVAPAATRASTHGFYLSLVLGGQRITERMRPGEVHRWKTWQQTSARGRMTDAVLAGDDRRPAYVD